ncbi:MAG: aminotransferase class IV [Clostridia bacterium]|nr:aminotransferase class IV [Clostridia bacterium]
MKNLAYYNGKISEIEEMMIPFNDRSSYFGDGCYDATYTRNHVVHDLEPHMDRFYRSAALLDIPVPMEKAELMSLIRDLVRKVDDGEQFVYWQLSRGTALRGHAYGDKTLTPNLSITLKPCKTEDTYIPIGAITVEDTRFYHCNIKTLNLLPNVLAAEKARAAGCGEAILYRIMDGKTRVTECAHSNIHILKDGVFRTAPLDNLILPGIARANLIRACGELGIPVKEEAFSLEEMMDADEVIHSSCGSFCVPIDVIDGENVGGRDAGTLKKLQDHLVAEFTAATEV